MEIYHNMARIPLPLLGRGGSKWLVKVYIVRNTK